LCSFSGCVVDGAGQRKAQPLKTSIYPRFRGLWVVVVARVRSNTQVVLVSRVGVEWWWPEEGPTPENELLGGMGSGGGQGKTQPLKTSGYACFVWCGWWWWVEEGPIRFAIGTCPITPSFHIRRVSTRLVISHYLICT